MSNSTQRLSAGIDASRHRPRRRPLWSSWRGATVCADEPLDRQRNRFMRWCSRPLQHMLCVAVSMNVARRPLTLLW